MVDWARVLGMGTLMVLSLVFAVLTWLVIPYAMGTFIAQGFPVVVSGLGKRAFYFWCLGVGPAVLSYAATFLFLWWTSYLRWRQEYRGWPKVAHGRN